MASNVQIATKIKKGDTFRATLTARRSGTPIDITSVPVASEVRSQDGTFTFALTVNKTDPANGVAQVSGATDTWPEGTVLLWDVEYQEPSLPWSPPTRGIKIVEDDIGAPGPK